MAKREVRRRRELVRFYALGGVAVVIVAVAYALAG